MSSFGSSVPLFAAGAGSSAAISKEVPTSHLQSKAKPTQPLSSSSSSSRELLAQSGRDARAAELRSKRKRRGKHQDTRERANRRKRGQEKVIKSYAERRDDDDDALMRWVSHAALPTPTGKDAYFLDSRGDPHAVELESLDKRVAISFERAGENRLIIGCTLPDDQVALMLLKGAPGLSRGRSGEVSSKRYFESSSKESNSLWIRKLQSRKVQGPIPLDYIPFVDVEIGCISEEDEVHRWMERNRFLNEQTMRYPRDLQWLGELIGWQAIQPGVRPAAVLEKQYGMLQRALEENPGCEQIIINLLRKSEKFRERDDVASEWRTMLEKSPHSTTLWLEYIKFCMGDFATFSVEKCREIFSVSISSLIAILSNEAAPRETTIWSIVVLIRLACFFERQCGFPERAVATYQALLEFNVWCPGEIASLSFSEQLSSFESYWEAEHPRLGSPNHVSWRAWYASGEVPFSEKSREIPAASFTGSPQRSSWLETEIDMMRNAWMPLVALPDNDDGEDGDILHTVIVFDDVCGTLFDARDNIEVIEVLTADFLRCVGIDDSIVRLVRFESSNVLYSCDRMYESPNVAAMPGVASGTCTVSDLYFFGSTFERGHQSTRFELLENLISELGNSLIEIPPDRYEFCRLALHDILEYGLREHSTGLTLCALAMIASKTPCEALEYAKKTLNNRRGDMVLWHAYCRLLKLSGDVGGSAQAMETLLSRAVDLPDDAGRQCLLLFLDYLIMLVEDRDRPITSEAKRAALLRLVVGSVEKKLLPLGAKVSSIDLVKARSAFHMSLAESRLRPSEWSISRSGLLPASPACCVAVLYSWLEYFSVGIDAALTSISGIIVPLMMEACPAESREVQLEFLHVMIVLLARVHARDSRAVRPRILRKLLEDALVLYPSNPYFIATYVQHEQRFQSTGRLRRFFDSMVNCHEFKRVSPAVWIYASAWELDRPGTYHRRRSLLELALSRDCSWSVALWRLYMQFVLDQRASVSKDQSAGDVLKKIFYRAVRRCPWSKPLWIDGLRVLKSSLSDAELVEIVGNMVDKGLRLHREF